MCNTHSIDFNAPFIEATIPGVRQYRTSMKQVKEAVGLMLQGVLPQIFRIVQSAALRDENGTLDTRHKDRVLREVGELVQGLFVADGRFAFADDGVTARTPYAQLLNVLYVRVVMEAVYGQRDWLAKRVPADVFRFLSNAQPLTLGEAENPFLRRDGEDDEAFRRRLDDLRVFRPNPLAELDVNRQWVPMHLWSDDKGYQLSRRIWNNSLEVRSHIDDMISSAFREGMGALDLARILEHALLPGLEAIRTDRPYGTDVSYYAMRLARTEIARAANHAAFISAYTNPYVDRIDVSRSPNGSRECPICPQFATLSFGGERLREPYSIYAADTPPFHPNCVTPGQVVTTHRGKIPIENVQIGDYVLTHKGRFRRVLNAWSEQYDGLVHDIRTGFGRVELTSEHPVLASTGWRDAQLIQTGEQILHASVNIFPNLVTSVTECKPAESFQFSIPDSVFFGNVPINSIAFNSNLTGDKGKIKLILPDTEFADIFNFSSIKSFHHSTFNRVGNTFAAHTEKISSSDNHAGVMQFLGFRNFLTNIGSLGRVVFASEVEFCQSLGHFLGRFNCPSAIIVNPLKMDSFASCSECKSEMLHYMAQTGMGYSEFLGASCQMEFFNVVKIIDNILSGFTKFLSNALNVAESCGGLLVALSAQFPIRQISTLSTRNLCSGHDNLLSLSPDILGGFRSGNRSVEWVITPPQAHLNYNTVERVLVREYQGLVYNMSVEEDESYVVGDIVVHNCMCHVRPVVTDSPSTVTMRLQAVMEDRRAALFPPSVNPAAADALLQTLLHRSLNTIVAQFRGQFALPGF